MKNAFSCAAMALVFGAAVVAPAAEPAAVVSMKEVAESADALAARAALAKSAAFLVSQQKADGSFSTSRYPGLTGLALWAMAGSGEPVCAEAVNKAVDYILSCAQPNGGIYCVVPGRPGGGLSTYNTAVCLTALSFVKRDDVVPVILKGRTFLAASQLEGDDAFSGGFGYDSGTPRRYADITNTHFVLEAMRRTERFEDMRPAAEKRADLNWDAALKFVSSLQNGEGTGDNEGGFFYSPADAKAGTEKAAAAPAPASKPTFSNPTGGTTPAGVPGMRMGGGVGGGMGGGPKTEQIGERTVLRSAGSFTYTGLLAMVYCHVDRKDPRVRSAIDWAAKNWTVDENPGQGDTGLYFFYDVISRALGAAGFDELPRADGGTIAWRKDLLEKLAALQSATAGSWVNSNGRFWENDPVLATAYSMISLEFALGITR